MPSRDAQQDTFSGRTPLSSVLGIILGGGAGTRLYPLTRNRAKPAVPIGGSYRLIDVPLSNCLNSGISKVYVLTQFNSTSLNRHVARAYNQGAGGARFGGDGFVEVLAASQTPTDTAWFQGTADAVRQYAWMLEDNKNRMVRDVVVLSGDHLYRMDYARFVEAHRASGADVTIGALPVDERRASDFGLMKVDDKGRVTSFAEKPTGVALDAMAVDAEGMRGLGGVLGGDASEQARLADAFAQGKRYIASMGIYVFKKDVMLSLLRDDPSRNDFGSEIIPQSANDRLVVAYPFDGYWEDIGTIESFFEANLALCDDPPNFEFHSPTGPIYTSPRYLPPAKIVRCSVTDALVSHGASLEGCVIKRSVIGLRARIGQDTVVENALIMGADYYEAEAQRQALLAAGETPMGVGARCALKNVILDKNARIADDVVIENRDGVLEASHEDAGWFIRSGIVIVGRNATIPSGTKI